MAVAVAFFGVLLLISPAGIGMGDLKLAGPLGAYLGWLGATAFMAGLLAAWLLAAVTGLALLLAHRADRSTQIPFVIQHRPGAWPAGKAAGRGAAGVPRRGARHRQA